MCRILTILKFVVALTLLLFSARLVAQNAMPPLKITPTVRAARASGQIKLDGILNEKDWQRAPVISGFKQVEPLQGEPAHFDTEVKLLFDDKYLYIGIFAKDTIGKQGLRTNDLTRDFAFDNNDLVGIAIDAYNTKRNAIAFQVTPYGNLRDLQSFDDNVFDLDWNALWDAKTTITNTGWYAEIAIPFNTLTYPSYNKTDSVSWGVNFIRIHRRSNETSAFPGYPRSMDTYRMNYAADLKGLDPPKRELSVRASPYVVIENDRDKSNRADKSNTTFKAGGDVRWGNTPHSTVDVTINTDFAQADIDQQVINLTRFSIFLPEKRQFFLENAGLFTAGDNINNNLQPYFSRNIGLNQDGKPLPIIAGVKYTDRTSSRSIGFLYSLQNSDNVTPVTQFGVFRFVKNYGSQNNIGLLLTEKAASGSNNTVAGLTGVNRIGNYFRVNYLFSQSFDKQKAPGEYQNGTGANLTLDYTNNNISYTSNHTLVSEKYIPGIGFVSGQNLLTHNDGVIFYFRPKWKPDFIRSLQPGLFLYNAQQASDLRTQEGSISLYPVYFVFNNGSILSLSYKFLWENLNENFNLLNLNIAKGNYRFSRYHFSFTSDQSRKLSFDFTADMGDYYNGKLSSLVGDLTFAPVPNIFFIGSYQYNALDKIGINKGLVNTSLLTGTLRLALNPNVQLSSFYQYNSTLKNWRVNERFSWQYKPLSYIYMVFNSSKNNVVNELEQQTIFKISYLKQF